MTTRIFDDEFIQKAHDDSIYQDGVVEDGIAADDKKAREEADKKILEARISMAQRLLDKGYSSEEIACITGLSVDEVNALKAGMTLSGSNA